MGKFQRLNSLFCEYLEFLYSNVHSHLCVFLFLRKFATMIRNTILRRLGNCRPLSNVGRRYAHIPVLFNWEDPLDSANLYTEDELAIQETARSYCQERMLPRVLGA